MIFAWFREQARRAPPPPGSKSWPRHWTRQNSRGIYCACVASRGKSFVWQSLVCKRTELLNSLTNAIYGNAIEESEEKRSSGSMNATLRVILWRPACDVLLPYWRLDSATKQIMQHGLTTSTYITLTRDNVYSQRNVKCNKRVTGDSVGKFPLSIPPSVIFPWILSKLVSM